jgi:hypothetical protein
MAEIVLSVPRHKYERVIDLFERLEDRQISKEECYEQLAQLLDLRRAPEPHDHLHLMLEQEPSKITFVH